MLKEEWKDIINYEGIYQASTHGRIRSLDRYIRCGKSSERYLEGRILRQFKSKKGYLELGLYKDSKHKTHKVHRLVLTAFDRPPKTGEECNHKDGNKSNNHIENLEWCTHIQNMRHKDNIIGKHNRGERHGRHEITEQGVRDARDLLKEGKLNQKQIAEIFNVSQGIISCIKSGRTWGHIK